MNIRVLTAVALLLVACTPAPDASAPKPVAVPKSTTAELSRELNSPCVQDKDCAAIAGATCMGSGVGSAKSCRIVCKGATDDRCAAPNACLSAQTDGGAERFSCERTCTGDTDCHANQYSCQHVLGPTQRAFCVPSVAGK